jgi:ethanolamine ammonia-lyase large subunit
MIVSNLEDHFMGKLLGLPMGMAPCYTLHSRITPEGQQMATELLTAAGANYYMDVCLGTDRMLAYFDTSGHDVQTLREIHGKKPCAEHLAWGLGRGIFERGPAGEISRGPAFGDVRAFCESEAMLAELVRVTPAAYGFETAGPRAANTVSRKALFHQATAREAIRMPLSEEILSKVASFRFVRTKAQAKDEHLSRPDAGAELAEEDAKALAREEPEVQIVVTDGLSADAVHENVPDLLPVLMDGLSARGFRLGVPIAAKLGRVKLAEPIARRSGAKIVVMLVGERPGAGEFASKSLSAYLVLRLEEGAEREAAAKASDNPGIEFEYSVVSNIHARGLLPVEAASLVVEKVGLMLEHRAAGNRLEALVAEGRGSSGQYP